MRFASLGSGSTGNALVVESKQTRLMLDCGFSMREVTRRLARLELEPEQLTAVLVTHEHNDHISGVFKFAARHNLKIFITHGTLDATARYVPSYASLDINVIDSHSVSEINDIMVEAYPVPHDAREPVQFTFGDGNCKLGVLTDAGMITPLIEAKLTRCQALVLECNHDVELLMNGSYPWPLKQRISGRYGHLNNAAAAELLTKLDNSKLQHIIAAHLSKKNNTSELACKTLSLALNTTEDWVGIADQETGFAWRQIL
jgi:phosphoribosyl 1,2-cyclic phosphodiesterase